MSPSSEVSICHCEERSDEAMTFDRDMKILHIVRNIGDKRALDTAQAQKQRGHQVTLLLLHDAVLDRVPFEGEMLACADDVRARTGKTPFKTVDYDEIVTLIFEHDRGV